MEPHFYNSYMDEYKAALEILKKRKESKQEKIDLEVKSREKLAQLKDVMLKITKAKQKQEELASIEKSIKVKTKSIEETSELIELHRRKCHTKQMNIMHLHRVINEFKKQFSDDLKLSEKK